MRIICRSLFCQVVVALILGAIIGVFWPHFGEQLKPLGDGFIKLIKMIIAPWYSAWWCTVFAAAAI